MTSTSVISLQARVQCLSPGDATIFSNVHARDKRANGRPATRYGRATQLVFSFVVAS